MKDTISDYTKRGGRVVTFENAISVFAAEKSTSLFKAMRHATLSKKPLKRRKKAMIFHCLKSLGMKKGICFPTDQPAAYTKLWWIQQILLDLVCRENGS